MKISVYITSYNQEAYLSTAIESVLDQTLLPFEIIIVDDCSTDGSKELIDAYHKQKPDLIRPIYHEKNKGVTQSRIDAINFSSGDLVTYVDGDDFYEKTKLEEEMKIMKETGADLVFSNFYSANVSSVNPTAIWARALPELPAFGHMFKEVLLRQFPSNTLFRCELVKKEILDKTGLYDKSLQIFEDYDLKVRMSKIAKIAYSLKPLHFYRDNENGLSKSPKALHQESIKYIVNKHRDSLMKHYPGEERGLSVEIAQLLNFKRQKKAKHIIAFKVKKILKAFLKKKNDFAVRENPRLEYLKSINYQYEIVTWLLNY
jgi:glycosyltransferase involved in cell wall biosynthesis